MQSVQQAMVLQAMLLRHSLFLGSAALIVAGSGVDDKQRLVRKESEQLAVGLSAGGQLVDARRHVHTESAAVDDKPKHKDATVQRVKGAAKLTAVNEAEANDAAANDAQVEGDAKAESGHDLCGLSYLYGTEDTNNCSAGHNGGVSVNSITMCRDAAQKLGFPAGKPAEGFNFSVTDHFFEVYPRNCFKNDAEDVLWFNPYGTWPELPKGLPICHRPKFKLGTPSTDAGDCTGDYEKITDVEECRTYAGCTSHCIMDQFRIGITIKDEKGWYLGDVGESCSDTCSGMPGLLCDTVSVAKMTEITAQDKFTADVLNGATCSTYGASAATNGDFPSVDVAGLCTSYDSANTTGVAPTCDAPPGAAGTKRFCYCQYDEQYQIPEGTGPEYYDKRPAGCFVHATDNCTYFNVPRTAAPAGTIEGSPICAIKTHGQSAPSATATAAPSEAAATAAPAS